MVNWYVVTYKDNDTGRRRVSSSQGIVTDREEAQKYCNMHNRADMLRQRANKPRDRFTNFKVKKIDV